jgi:hypothetical protein
MQNYLMLWRIWAKESSQKLQRKVSKEVEVGAAYYQPGAGKEARWGDCRWMHL